MDVYGFCFQWSFAMEFGLSDEVGFGDCFLMAVERRFLFGEVRYVMVFFLCSAYI